MNMNITPAQLRHAADLQEKIQALQHELASLLGATAQPDRHPAGKRRMSAAGRARIAAAARARWAKFRANGMGHTVRKGNRRMSAAARARLAAIARARWKRAKASGRTAL